jgi:hypothetical protein
MLDKTFGAYFMRIKPAFGSTSLILIKPVNSSFTELEINGANNIFKILELCVKSCDSQFQITGHQTCNWE